MDDDEDTNRPPKPSYPEEGPDELEETEDQEPETDESDEQVDTTEESQGSADTEKGPKQDLIYLKSEDDVMF